jgi:polyhydroxybutyrate depolymerase
MRTHDLLPPATLVLLALSFATPGCGSVTPLPGDGTGGVANASGGVANASGGVANASGGVANASGGVANASGGVANASGGVANASGGGTASGGVGNASGGSGNVGTDEVVPSLGCGEAAPADGNATIDVDGLMREYILALPENYDPETPYRLIFGWHPWGGSAEQVAGQGYYGLLSASEGQAILVSPEGLDFGGNGLGWGNEGGQDIAFLEAMLERFDSELCFDHNRIFSTGFSFGGMMSNAVACSGLARAVAPQAGSFISGCADGTQPVAYMGFHGDVDSVVTLPTGEEARDEFVARNGCGAGQPSASDWCDLVPNNQPCECTDYQGCTEGYPVTWCQFSGNHTPAPNSGQTIWDFFAQF